MITYWRIRELNDRLNKNHSGNSKNITDSDFNGHIISYKWIDPEQCL